MIAPLFPGSKRAIVVGGGIAGLAAGIALRDAAYDVTILEQAPAIRPIGAALSLWGNAMAALSVLGASADICTDAAPIREIGARDQQGKAILNVDIARAYPAGAPVPRLATRALLQSSLLAAATGIELRFGEMVTGLAQSSVGATASLAGGACESADLVVVADGIRSKAASGVLGTVPFYSGYGGVLALSDAAPGAAENGDAYEYWGRAERFGLFDLGGQRTYWFYMRNEQFPAESEALTMADIESRLPAWPEPLAWAVRATPSDRLIPFSVHAKPPPKRLGRGRIICVGDAAHAMEPNLGQGGCQALEDAVALGVAARCREPASVLPLFEALRLARIRQFVRASHSARLAAQSRHDLLAGVLRAAMRVLPQRVVASQIADLHRLPDYAALASRA